MPPPSTPTLSHPSIPLTSSTASLSPSAAPRYIIAGHSSTTGAALHGLSQNRLPSTMNAPTRPAVLNAALASSTAPMSTMKHTFAASTSTANMPLIQEPIRFPIPAYLRHSAFADAFIVGSSLASSLSRSQPQASTSTASTPRLASSSVAGSVSTIAQTAGNDKGKQRDISLSADGKRDHAGRSVDEYRVSLPSRLDAAHCCKRLLISQDGYGLQYMPERDEHGRESELGHAILQFEI